MSARSRSRPWYRDPFDLGEAGAACLDGQSVEHALPDAVPLCDQCAWVLQYDMLQGKPRGWRFRGGYHVVVL